MKAEIKIKVNFESSSEFLHKCERVILAVSRTIFFLISSISKFFIVFVPKKSESVHADRCVVLISPLPCFDHCAPVGI